MLYANYFYCLSLGTENNAMFSFDIQSMKVNQSGKIKINEIH